MRAATVREGGVGLVDLRDTAERWRRRGGNSGRRWRWRGRRSRGRGGFLLLPLLALVTRPCAPGAKVGSCPLAGGADGCLRLRDVHGWGLAGSAEP